MSFVLHGVGVSGGIAIGHAHLVSRAKLEAAGLLKDVPYQIEWSVFPAAVNLHEALKADAIDIGQAADSPTTTPTSSTWRTPTQAAVQSRR